jgi:hypothetical protein
MPDLGGTPVSEPPAPTGGQTELEGRIRHALHIDAIEAKYSHELDEYTDIDFEDERYGCRELIDLSSKLMAIASNNPASTRINWEYLPHSLDQNNWTGKPGPVLPGIKDRGDCFNTVLGFLAEALPGNTHLRTIHISGDSIGQPTLARRIVGMREDVFTQFMAALAQSSVNTITFPDDSWFDPDAINFDEEGPTMDVSKHVDASACEVAKTRIVSLQKQCVKNSVRMVAADDPSMLHFVPYFTAGELTPEERTLFKNLVCAICGNTHLQNLLPTYRTQIGLWHCMIRDRAFMNGVASDEAEGPYFHLLVEALPRSKVFQLDVAEFWCTCNPDVQCVLSTEIPALSIQVRTAQTSLMRACVSNAASRLATNDPATCRIIWENKNLDAEAILSVAAAMHGNSHLAVLAMYDRHSPTFPPNAVQVVAGVDPWQQPGKVHSQSCAAGAWRDVNSDAIVALKTAIRRSSVETVFVYPNVVHPDYPSEDSDPSHDLPVQRELNDLCQANKEFAKRIAAIRPLQRLLLSVICQQRASVLVGGRSPVTCAPPLPRTAILGHLDQSRGCPGRGVWERADVVEIKIERIVELDYGGRREERVGTVELIADGKIVEPSSMELFTWHAIDEAAQNNMPAAKRARAD